MSKSKRFGKALSWLGRTGFRVVRQMMAPSISVFSYLHDISTLSITSPYILRFRTCAISEFSKVIG